MPTADDARQRYEEQFRQMEAYYYRQIEQLAPAARQAAWRRDYASPEAYRRSVAGMRQRYIELLGDWPKPEERSPALNPRVESVASGSERFTAQRVWLSCVPGVDVYGILLEARDAKGRLPAVIAQHGYGGFPEATCGLAQIPGTEYLRDFGRQLVERGYVVFAPLVMHSELLKQQKLPVIDRVWLDRLAMMVGQQFQAFEIFKITRVVDYLAALPNVRPDRIGIMGISQGGMTALLTAAMDERIAASVCSCYFNDRTKKMVHRSTWYTPYISTVEADKFFRGHLLAFADADVASLICPRPFCVEQGKKDRVIGWEDAQAEFERARSHWDKLNLGGCCAFVAFDGEHVVEGKGSFEFLDRWLK